MNTGVFSCSTIFIKTTHAKNHHSNALSNLRSHIDIKHFTQYVAQALSVIYLPKSFWKMKIKSWKEPHEPFQKLDLSEMHCDILAGYW